MVKKERRLTRSPFLLYLYMVIENKKIFDGICLKILNNLPKQYPKINKNSFKKSLLVESRFNLNVEFSIKNTIHKLGGGWGHIIVCVNSNHQKIKELTSIIDKDIEIINLGDTSINQNIYNNLLLDINFWDKINCDKVLIYQPDTFIFKNFNDDFLEWDYIGAPWGPSKLSKLTSDIYGLNKEILMGNGGLSLRNVNVIKEILETKTPYPNYDPNFDKMFEDIFFSYHTETTEHYHPAPLEIASKFSFEHIFKEDAFGCHKPYSCNFVEEGIFDNFLKEVKKHFDI